jgi:hypothetical protein
MGLRIKLILIIIAMILFTVAIVLVFTLVRASSMQTSTTYDYAEEMASGAAVEIQRRIEVYTDYTKILAEIFSDFETTAESQRRTMFNDILLSITTQNENIPGVWTAWLPNTIDSYDAQQGQYKTYYTRRRTGSVEDLSAQGYDGW